MARDPDQGSAVVFDLVEQDADGVEASPADGADRPGATDDVEPPPIPRRSGHGWRAAASAAAVLAVALGTGIASDGVRENARTERIRDVPGGVANLSAPLEETWAWDGVVGGEQQHGYGLGGGLVILGRLLVFPSGTDLVALDPGTGKEAWVVPVGDDAECGPTGISPYEGPPIASVQAVVCVHGRGTDREVVVVQPDGEVSAARTLDPADTRRFGAPRPGPDGTVLRATRVGALSQVDLGDATCEYTGECSGMVRSGRDVELRAEDAVTGAERWSVTIPFREAPAGACWNVAWEDPAGVLTLDGSVYPDAFGARITPDLVRLEGCGVGAAVTPQGAVLGAESERGMTPEVGRFAAGRYAWLDYESALRTVVYSGDGTVVGEFPGYVSGPRVADGSGPEVLLGIDATGLRLHAYSADGARRWDVGAIGADQPYLAQVGRTVVIAGDAMDVRGLDAATGAERWRWDGSADGDGVLQAFTDGRSVLLDLTRNDSGVPRMVSLDVATGEVLWREGDEAANDDSEQSVPTLVAVDGHLLEVDHDGVRGLG